MKHTVFSIISLSLFFAGTFFASCRAEDSPPWAFENAVRNYETDAQKQHNNEARIPNLGIGKGTIVKRAIIDHNACIGEGCRIGVDDINRADGNYTTHYIVDGIIVIPKNTVLYPGTVI